MGQLPTGEPVWDLQFDEGGRLTAPDRDAFIGEVRNRQIKTLFMFAHGWGTSTDHATKLFNAMFPLIRAAAHPVAALGPVGFAGIYWPSLWFPPTTATAPALAGAGQAAGAGEALDAGTAQVSGKEIADSLRPGYADPGQQDQITQIGQLIDQGEAMAGPGATDTDKQQLIGQISELIRKLTPAVSGSGQDAGETVLLTTSDPVHAYRTTAAVFGTTPGGGAAQGLGDWFGAAINGAKDAVRALSYWTMKSRAGTIGQTGLGPLLAVLHEQVPAIRVSLTGHSFGARLVSFALAGIDRPEASPVCAVSLLQGAFSHWSFADAAGNPFGAPGGLFGRGDRVQGPLVATFSGFDWAVGVWYPRASFLAGSNTAAAAGPSRWGGMGSDGFQPGAVAATVPMPAQGDPGYQFTPKAFYRIDANKVINNVKLSSFAGAHSDIEKAPVAELIVAAAATGS